MNDLSKSLTLTKRKKISLFLMVIFLFVAGGFVYYGSRNYRADEVIPPAPTVTWSGAGNDTTCAGGAGSGNWWSCTLNWSTGVTPTAADHVIFDATSPKNSTIDTAFTGTIHSITIQYNYGGQISQSRNLRIDHDFTQNGATFNSNPSYTFSVGGSFFVADNQVSNGSVNAIRGDSDGKIYIGGDFTAISGQPIKYLARFDGKSWQGLGDFDGPVKALAIDTNNNVYAGGSFTKIGNLTVNSIAEWNGSSWAALGGGLTDGYGATPSTTSVTVLALDDQNILYVGGTFENAGSVQHVNHIVRFDGTNWQKFNYGLGSTITTSGDGNSYLNGYVSQIIIKNNANPAATDKDIYIGGSFSNICGNDLCNGSNTTGKNIVKYDGLSKTMATLNGGLLAAVTAMIFDASDRLTIHSPNGIHATAGSAGSTCSLGYFDGTSWFCHSAIAGGINKFIKINGVVYAGGNNYWPGALINFNEAIKGAPNYNYYSASVPLGNGLNGTVYDLADIGGVLYASGSFTGSIVKYNSAESNKAKQLVSPFNKSIFNRYTGDGSSATPYQVSDVYGLQAIILSPTKYYALSGNIDAATTSNWNNGNGIIPIGNLMNSFSGNFNGQSHTINGFVLANFDQYAGLFGYVDKTGIIANLNITGANLNSTKTVNSVGILAGKNLGLISNINVAGSINITSPSAKPGLSVGGVVGYNTNLNYGARGSQTGVAYNPAITYNIGDKALSGRVYVAIQASTGVPVDNTDFWRGTGDVNVTSLSNITSNVSIAGAYISDVGGILGTQEKIPITTGGYPYFYEASRIFETLSGLKAAGSLNIANSKGNIGGIIGRQDYEFGLLKDSQSAVTISTTVPDGLGGAGNSQENIGGLIGYSFGRIATSFNSGKLTCNVAVNNVDLNGVGGLVGKIDNPSSLNSIIADSYNTADLDLDSRSGAILSVGGLAGTSKIGSIANSHSSGTTAVTSNGEVKYVGGLTGYNFQSNITTSYSSSALQIDNHTASNQLATGGFGGLTGFAQDSNITTSYASGNVSANADSSCLKMGGVGGLVGIYSTNPGYSLNQSYATGGINANCLFVGGLAGQVAGNLDQSFATGNVSGRAKVGGLVGGAVASNDSITNSFSLGNVTATGLSSDTSFAGGLIGFARNLHVASSYSLGTVVGNGPNGGFTGGYDQRDADFAQSYYFKSSQYNNGLSDVGAELVDGEGGSNVNRNQNLNGQIMALTKEDLRNQLNFQNWNFDQIWSINNQISYPCLKTFSNFASVVSSVSATAVSAASTTLNGNITTINTFKPYLRGFLYGTDLADPNFLFTDTGNNGWNGNFETGIFSASATALPDGTYSFRAFASSLGGTSLGNISQFTISGSPYNLTIYTITSTSGAHGQVLPTGAVSATGGSNKTFSILPDSNYHIKDVLVDGSSIGAVSSHVFSSLAADHTISATFEVNIPAAVGNISFTNIDSTSFDIIWQDHSTTEDGFHIFVANTNADCSIDATYNGILAQNSAANATAQGLYHVSNTSVNSRYCTKVVAYNSTGEAGAAYSAARYTLANIPGLAIASSGYNVTDGNFVNLNIAVNANPDATKYLIQTSTAENGTYSNITNHSWNSSKTVKIVQADFNFNSNTQYYFKVKAQNGETNPVQTDLSAATSFVTPPVAPATLAATNSCGGKAMITWSGSTGADKYTLSYGNDDKATNLATYNDIFVFSRELNNLTINTPYFAKVSAVSLQNGTGPASTILPFTSSDCTYMAPTDFRADAATLTSDSITWRWSDSAQGESGYKVEDNQNQLKSPLLAADTTSWQETRLSPNQQVIRHVRVWNANGTSRSNEITVYTKANTPYAPTLKVQNSSSIKVKISQDGNSAETHYAVKETTTNKYVRQSDGRLVSTADWQKMAVWNTGDGDGIMVNGLNPKTKYTFALQAANEGAMRFDQNLVLQNILTDLSVPTSATTGVATTVNMDNTQISTYKNTMVLRGTKSPEITKIIINGSEYATSKDTTTWTVEINLSLGQNNLNILGQDSAALPSLTKSITITRRKIGDFNNDGKIDGADFTLLLFNYGSAVKNNSADFNEDGKVDASDFTLLLYWWGK